MSNEEKLELELEEAWNKGYNKAVEKAVKLWNKHILKADITVEEFEKILKSS